MVTRNNRGRRGVGLTREGRRELEDALVTSNLGAALHLLAPPIALFSLAGAVVAAAFGQIAHLSLPLLALAVVTYPIVHDRSYDIVSPWTLVWLATLIGGPVRGAYIVLDWPDNETIDFLFLRNQSDSFFIGPILIMLLGLAALAYGYSLRSEWNVTRLPRFLNAEEWLPGRMWFVVVFAVAVSVASLLAFVSALGGFDPTDISGKHGTLTGLDIDQNYQSYFHLRVLNDFGIIVALVVLAHYAFSNQRLTPGRVALLGVLFANGTALSLWASSRRSVLFPALSALVIWILAGRSVRIRSLALVALSGLLVFQVMTFARKVQDDSIATVLTEAVDLRTAFDPLVVNRSLLGLTTSAHVIDAIPSELDYAYGETLVVPMLAPVPRFIWKDKPVISQGATVGAVVFGQRNGAGNPPGLIAELFWNFSLPGVLIGAFITGFLLRKAYETVRPLAGRRNVAVLYAVALYPLGMALLTGEITKSLMASAIDVVQVTMVLAFISQLPQRRPRRRPSAPVWNQSP